MEEAHSVISTKALSPVTTPPPRGDLLEDRIRDGFSGSLAEQVAIALQIARILIHWHRHGKSHADLRSRWICLNENDIVTVFGPETPNTSQKTANIQAFGFVLFELLSGQLITASGLPNAAPDTEILYQAGISPRLIDLVTLCTSNPPPSSLQPAVNILQDFLLQTLGQSNSIWARFKKLLAR